MRELEVFKEIPGMNSTTICNVIFLDKSYLYDKVLRSSEEHSNVTIDNNCVYV